MQRWYQICVFLDFDFSFITIADVVSIENEINKEKHILGLEVKLHHHRLLGRHKTSYSLVENKLQ